MYYSWNRYGKREKSRVKPLPAARKAEIIAAIQADDAETLEQILESGVIPDPNRSLDSLGWNAVLYACKAGSLRCLRLLHERGAHFGPVQGISPFPGWARPLQVAVNAERPAVVKELLALGVKVDERNGNSETALFSSTCPECTNLLIRAGADVNAADSLGYTPLTLSIRRGDRESVRILLEAGADPLFRPGEICRPCFAPAAGRRPDIEALFEDTVNRVLDRIEQGDSAAFLDYLDADMHRFAVAARRPFPTLLEAYLNIGGDPHIRDLQGQTLFHHAVKHNDAAGIRALVEKNVSIDAQDRERKTALHYAIRDAETFPCFKALVDGGADAEIRAGMGMTVKEQLNFGMYRKWWEYIEERDALQAACCSPGM